jgi:hypothetical protein
MKYLCELLYGGNVRVFAQKLGIRSRRLRDALEGEHTLWMHVLLQVVQLGLCNAEWLFCGTGPIRPQEKTVSEPPITLAAGIVSSHPRLNTLEVQYEQVLKPPIPTISQAPPDETAFSQARAIYAARSANKPVVLFLGHEAVAENVGPTVNTMLEKGYVTGVALSSAAALRDFERALFGGRASRADGLHELLALNTAALRAATSGMGYGEVLGRWGFPVESNRAMSVLARAYELHRPATVHLALGDSMHHFFPAKFGAELGAALGAASYVDMLVFAAEVRELQGNPSGVFISADTGEHAVRLFSNSLAAYEGERDSLADDVTQIFIRREYRHTFPALLTACDAVYAGTADDVRRMRRK